MTLAAACPKPALEDVEAGWRAVIDAERADLALLQLCWPDWQDDACQAAIRRHHQRGAPGGEAERALAALHAVYGGQAQVPADVRARLEAYTREQLVPPPWPLPDPTEDPDEPALWRKRRRLARRAALKGHDQ